MMLPAALQPRLLWWLVSACEEECVRVCVCVFVCVCVCVYMHVSHDCGIFVCARVFMSVCACVSVCARARVRVLFAILHHNGTALLLTLFGVRIRVCTS